MADLQDFRREIDAIDDQVVDLLARRAAAIRGVGAYKKRHGIPAYLPARVEAVLTRCAGRAAQRDLDPAFVRALYEAIVAEACRIEDEIIHAEAA